MDAYRTYCFKILHDGRYTNSGCRPRRLADECHTQPCTEHAPYAEDKCMPAKQWVPSPSSVQTKPAL